MNLAFLDTGTLGRISNPRAIPVNLRCRQWARSLVAAGYRVVVPEIADYEVRRELLRVGATAGLARPGEGRLPLRGADDRRRAPSGRIVDRDPAEGAADGVAGLAGRGRDPGGAGVDGGRAGDTVIVATDNVGHLGRFVDARVWDQIVP